MLSFGEETDGEREREEEEKEGKTTYQIACSTYTIDVYIMEKKIFDVVFCRHDNKAYRKQYLSDCGHKIIQHLDIPYIEAESVTHSLNKRQYRRSIDSISPPRCFFFSSLTAPVIVCLWLHKHLQSGQQVARTPFNGRPPLNRPLKSNYVFLPVWWSKQEVVLSVLRAKIASQWNVPISNYHVRHRRLCVWHVDYRPSHVMSVHVAGWYSQEACGGIDNSNYRTGCLRAVTEFCY